MTGDRRPGRQRRPRWRQRLGRPRRQRRAAPAGRLRLGVPFLLLLLILGGAGCGPNAAATTDDEPLRVAAAADLQPAFTVLAADFERATGEEVVFSFGSSGQLAQQLTEGAPMDLFAAANVSFVERVLAAGVGDPHSQTTYAQGRITIWSSDVRWGDWPDLEAVAADRDVSTIAIANPEHAPYGLAAQQALQAAGVWDEVEPRLVFGENIADTQRLAATGNADVAILALSLALAADEAGDGAWVLIDDALHEPLQQDLIVVTSDPARAEVASRFIAHVDSEDGREVMRRFGFLLPGEATVGTGGD